MGILRRSATASCGLNERWASGRKAAMAKIGFIGLGNMGAPMAANLIKAGHKVTGFDLVREAVEALEAKGGSTAPSAVAAAAASEIVITMLPAGPQVRSVYLGEDGLLAHAG